VAAFPHDPESWRRLDYRLLQNGAVTLYRRAERLREDARWLASHGYDLKELAADGWDSLDRFHAGVAAGLGFPDHSGRNLNAFADCLADLRIPEEDGGTALVFWRYDAFASRFPEPAHGVLDVVETASRRFLLTGRRLLCLVQSDDPRISFPALGASDAQWNPQEWLDSSRGP
jgi:Barstar (barnase inhibitor)